MSQASGGKWRKGIPPDRPGPRSCRHRRTDARALRPRTRPRVRGRVHGRILAAELESVEAVYAMGWQTGACIRMIFIFEKYLQTQNYIGCIKPSGPT